MFGAIDSYWESLHCVRTLIVPLLTQMYKWVLVTEQRCRRGTLSIGALQEPQSGTETVSLGMQADP